MRAVLLCLLLLSCSDPMPAVMDATVARDASDAAAEASVRPELPRPMLDPRLFDCTATMPPMRRSTVGAACALDPTCRTPMISGHRGAGGDLGRIAPEDTLSAYRAAIALGIEFVETDPRPTADGVLVNVHDTTVDRTTSGTGEVLRMTAAEVRALRIQSGRYAGDFSCERVPTLVEILQLCRGRAVVLVDANKTDRVDLLVRAIQDADARDWAVFDTSDVGKIQRALAIDPTLRVQIRPRTVAEITSQLDQLAPHLPVLVEIARSDVAAGAPIIHARGTRVFTDIFVEDVVVGLQGDLSYYGRVLDDGADVVQTDRPDLVLDVLRRRGQRP